jgi:voltage-gated potassium channel
MFMDFSLHFWRYVIYLRAVIGSLVTLIVLGGFAISRLENIELGNAIYLAFITALSVGYGDISPQTGLGKVVCIVIGLIGILYVGMTAAIANRALADTMKQLDE